MDLLGAVLRELDVHSETPWRLKLTGRWAATGEPGARSVYAVLDGACEALAEGQTRGLVLQPGDVAVFPRGDPHHLRSVRGPWPAAAPLRQLGSVDGDQDWNQSPPEQTRLVCATFRVEGAPEHPAVAALPPTIALHAGTPPGERNVAGCIASIAAELSRPRSASALLLERLMDIVVLEAFRTVRWNFGGAATWLSALVDPLLAPALGRIHCEPERRWTVAALAAETQRARAPFSTRFRHKVGVPPRTFLDQVRMHRAKKLLLASRLPLAEIARSVGFGSHRAFRRAFVRATGITPTAYRGAERARRVTGPRAPSPPGPRAEPTDR